jgi:hypothetical protein
MSDPRSDVVVGLATVVIIGTESDRLADLLAAGQATERVSLTATFLDIAASPVGQPADTSAAVLRAAVGDRRGRHVQMLIRVGYPVANSVALSASLRRPAEDLLRNG